MLPSERRRALESLLPGFSVALALGLALGLGTSGLPLVGACLAIAVLSLVSAIQTSRRAKVALAVKSSSLH